MALDDRTVPYEILIRFGPGGTPLGAHVQRRRIVTLDGEVLKDEVGEAEPLGLADFPTSTIMTAATEAALIEIATLHRQAEQHDTELAELKAQLSASRSRLDEPPPAS